MIKSVERDKENKMENKEKTKRQETNTKNEINVYKRNEKRKWKIRRIEKRSSLSSLGLTCLS